MSNRNCDEPSKGDWLCFLESRRSTCISVLISLLATIIAIFLGFTTLIDQWLRQGHPDPFWSTVIIAGSTLLISIYLYGTKRFGRPYIQAVGADEIVNRICQEDIDIESIQREWEKVIANSCYLPASTTSQEESRQGK